MHKIGLEVLAELSEIGILVLGKQKQLTLMTLAFTMTFETVLVTALFATHLAEPENRN